MSRSQTTVGLVLASLGSYALALGLMQRHTSIPTAAQIKSISAGHAALMTLLCPYALHPSQWHMSKAPKSETTLDDSSNSLIQSRSELGNAVTSWETGYLVYDTLAMLQAQRKSPRVPVSGVMMTHHILLGSAFLYLQKYIAQSRERGVRVIITLMLMYASNPLLHARWWLRKKGKRSGILDLAFVLVFAACRFGTVLWMLRLYGNYHQIGPLQAFRRLRLSCQAGTASLVLLNGAWWTLLVRNLLLQRSHQLKVPSLPKLSKS